MLFKYGIVPCEMKSNFNSMRSVIVPCETNSKLFSFFLEDGYDVHKMSDLFDEIWSVRELKKPNGDWADWVTSIADFDTFQPRDNGMVAISISFNSSKEYLEAVVDFLNKEKILVT